jgi:hypothetical protein
LIRDFPGLAVLDRDKVALAARLIDGGRILPILHGFDELWPGHGTAAVCEG